MLTIHFFRPTVNWVSLPRGVAHKIVNRMAILVYLPFVNNSHQPLWSHSHENGIRQTEPIK